MTRSAIILAILPALAGGTQPVGRPQELVVKFQHVGDGCFVTLDGVHLTFDALLEAARREHTRPAVIIFGGDLPYKCIGATVITLQEAGVMNIDARPSLRK